MRSVLCYCCQRLTFKATKVMLAMALVTAAAMAVPTSAATATATVAATSEASAAAAPTALATAILSGYSTAPNTVPAKATVVAMVLLLLSMASMVL